MKIVINKSYGAFGLSDVAATRYKNETGNTIQYWDIPRDCPILVSIVEELGEDSWGRFAELRVVEIPDDVKWEISQQDGLEWVDEWHRKWY